MHGMRKCPDCFAERVGIVHRGDGRCGPCLGTGQAHGAAADEAACERCRGKGLCFTCGGFGLVDSGGVPTGAVAVG